MRVAIGSDHAGFDTKTAIKSILAESNHEIVDVGTYGTGPVDYADYAEATSPLCATDVARADPAVRQRCRRVDGGEPTSGVRAGLCHDTHLRIRVSSTTT